MKKLTTAIIAIVLVTIGGIFVFGQRADFTRGGKEFGQKGDHPHHGMCGRRGPGMMLRGLDLTDVQKEQVKAIITASREGTKSLRDQIQANHDQIEALTEAGGFDEPRVRELAGKQGALHAQMIVEKQKVKSQIFALLTPEQKAKAAEMKTQFKQKMQERMQNRMDREDPEDAQE